VCPPGIELAACEIVRLPGHPRVLANLEPPGVGLGKLIGAVDLVIQPAPDGMAHDAARLQRIAAAFMARPEALVERTGPKARTVDVRAMVTAVEPIDGEVASRICAALDWPFTSTEGPLLRARILANSDGSAKPPEVARALGVWGSDDPRGVHARVARLGVVAGHEASSLSVAMAAAPPVTARS
jgi:hypothetical protein